jgi:hypothetical protein
MKQEEVKPGYTGRLERLEGRGWSRETGKTTTRGFLIEARGG